MTFMDKARQALASVKTVLKSSAGCVKTVFKRQAAKLRREFLSAAQRCLVRFPKYRRRVLLKQGRELATNIKRYNADIRVYIDKRKALQRTQQGFSWLRAHTRFQIKYLQNAKKHDRALLNKNVNAIGAIPQEGHYVQFA